MLNVPSACELITIYVEHLEPSIIDIRYALQHALSFGYVIWLNLKIGTGPLGDQQLHSFIHSFIPFL